MKSETRSLALDNSPLTPAHRPRACSPAPSVASARRPLVRFVRSYGPAAALLAGFFGAWQTATVVFALPAWLLPSPLEIARTLMASQDLLRQHVPRTVEETLAGFAAAFATGVVCGLAIDYSPTVRRALLPLLIASQTIPMIAIAPLLVIWFGYGLLPKMLVVALICFFPIVINTVDGLRSVDPEMASLVRSMGASPGQVFRLVRLPGALPHLFSGTKIAVTYTVIAAIVGEWAGASQGLGIYMIRASDQLLTARVFAAIVVSSTLSILLFLAVTLVERLIVRWGR